MIFVVIDCEDIGKGLVLFLVYLGLVGINEGN